MHACLNVGEILRLIASELVASKTRATTVALACCCKSFEDPVLDVLWETQCQLLSLLKSFPGDVWNGGKCTVSAPTTYVFSSLTYFISKSFKRLPTMLEWARFQKYARRMRSLAEHATLGSLSSEVLSVLQLRTANEPLLPNLKTLSLQSTGEFIPFIPLFLSPRTTDINISLSGANPPKALVASILTTLSTMCPNLQQIYLHSLPSDPMIVAAVSGILLASNRSALQRFEVDSPLTEEGREVICKLPNLRKLSTVIERDTSLSLAGLPNLTSLTITYDHDRDWVQMFHGATLEKLESVTFDSESEQIGDFLGTFESVALAASAQNTLSKLCLYTSLSWNPVYTSLLSFTQMTYLEIAFFCGRDCSSTVDDDVITDLARAMPKLEHLVLGNGPCYFTPTGVTIKGFAVLAHYCPNLSVLCVHFQVDSLVALPATAGMASNAGSTTPRRDCNLQHLRVGEIPVPDESVSMVALVLARIFPRIKSIEYVEDDGWKEVMDIISLSRQIIDCSSKQDPPSLFLEVTSMTPH